MAIARPPSAPLATSNPVRLRIAVMMIFQNMSLGIWTPTLGTYIGANTGDSGAGLFGGSFVGVATSTAALGALIAPLVLGVVADRYFSIEKMLAALHAAGAFFLWNMLHSESQTTFLIWLLLFFQAYAPTASLTVALTFRHLPRNEFPLQRSLGTGGWVAAGLFIGFVAPRLFGQSIEAGLQPFYFGVAIQSVYAVYCLTLPATPPLPRRPNSPLGSDQLAPDQPDAERPDPKQPTNGRWGGLLGAHRPGVRRLAGLRALLGGDELWGNRSLMVFIAITVLACMPSQFYNTYINLYLNNLGFEGAAGKMTIGQVVEMVCLVAMPWLLLRLGVKRLYLIGVLAWVVRFGLFAMGDAGDRAWMVYVGLTVHGVAFAFVYITAQLYVDRLTAPESRASAQGALMLMTQGVGHFSGAMLAGGAQQWLLTPQGVSPAPYDWRSYWLIPLGVSGMAAFLFWRLFAGETAAEASDSTDEGLPEAIADEPIIS
ncbi:putative nucleoside transporter YegT [Pseudobythopirellula maris]|uniref:Putative nucleoside transporter YegT n=1 Tax=Pseudobythopirellula maris TaxID=2527991 RepID=A0A5C5ZUE5_9BACT|nr:MFS transporter [Pseudobythopirellula maris]TWT90658.1 putative nucleoside transporter YegT [Pseudobythopirellula maris]